MINEDALEAALLAKMVSMDLTKIDNSCTERSNIPAARINMNQFIGEINPPMNSPAISPATPFQNIVHQPTVPVISSEVNSILSEELKEDIKSIRFNMEKININLTKISGMFGKVFHNMNKQHND